MIIWTKRFLRVLGLSAGVTLGCDTATNSGPAGPASPSATDTPAATDTPNDDPVDQPVAVDPIGPADPVDPADPADPVDDPADPVDDPADPVDDPADPVDDPVDVADAVARIDQNLESLRALELFEVGELLVMSPNAGGSCYGYPCSDEVEAVRARLATELERLVALSEDLDSAGTESCDPALTAGDAAAHLETLANLHIVRVGAFLEVAPANNPMCYNLPCQEDIAAAEAANCDKLARLADLTHKAATEFDAAEVKTPSAEIADIDVNLSYLRQLDIVEVGELLVGASVERESCYVCPPDIVEQDEVMAADRLQALRDIAEENVGDYGAWDLQATAECDLSAAAVDLAALAALKIVEVGTLIERHPSAEGLCYAGGCSEAEFAQAHALACRRAAALATLVPRVWHL